MQLIKEAGAFRNPASIKMYCLQRTRMMVPGGRAAESLLSSRPLPVSDFTVKYSKKEATSVMTVQKARPKAKVQVGEGHAYNDKYSSALSFSLPFMGQQFSGEMSVTSTHFCFSFTSSETGERGQKI